MICSAPSIWARIAGNGARFWCLGRWKLQLKWSASGTKSSFEFFTAKISFQSNVSSLKYTFHYLFPLWVALFFFCEVFFKSVQWVTKSAAAALVSLEQNKISADSWCTVQVSHKLRSPSETSALTPSSNHLQSLLRLQERQKAPLHAAQISVTKCDISCLRLKSAVTSPPCLRPGKLAAVLERFHRLSIQSRRCCSFWQRVAGFPSGRKSAEKNDFAVGTSRTRASTLLSSAFYFVCRTTS